METQGEIKESEWEETEQKRSLIPAQLANSGEYASSGESKLAAFVYEVIQQTQAVMENLLPLIKVIDAEAVEIDEEVHRCREWSLDRKSKLEEERERFQQAACRVLDMLTHASASPLQIEAANEEEDSHQT